MNIIETTNLTKNYGGVNRVDSLCIHVPEGCVYGFLGPNGAGKSTTLKMLLGLVHPTDGEISVLGQPMTKKNRLTVLREVGSLIESPSYYGHLTGFENLRIAAELRGLDTAEIEDALSAVRLTNSAGRLVKQYSLGMKQRLGLALALLGYPKLLILDEPTNGLDPAGIQEMRELIENLPQKYGMTILISSHLLSEIDQMAECVGIIREGALVFEGSLSELHEKSGHGLCLRTTNLEQTKRWLVKKEIAVRQTEEQTLLLPMLCDEAASELMRDLTAQNIYPLRLEEQHSSLEDIFLHLTGKAASL